MELLKRNLIMVHLISITMFLTYCSLFYPTVKVEVPKGYIGWCYVVPINDTAGINFEVVDGKYQINKDGIVYVPASTLNLKRDNVIKVYDNGIDISNAMRYAGNIYKVTEDGSKYKYISFYLPSLEERKIADYEQYWRDKQYDYSQPENKRFDSLLRQQGIIFK